MINGKTLKTKFKHFPALRSKADLFVLYIMCKYGVPSCGYMYHVYAWYLWSQKGEMDPWELELKMVMSFLTWMLETDLRTFRRAASVTTEASLQCCISRKEKNILVGYYEVLKLLSVFSMTF